MMSLKVIHFQSIFLIYFILKKTDLCAEIWNTSPNCCAAGNSKRKEKLQKKEQKVAEQYRYDWLKEVAEKAQKD